MFLRKTRVWFAFFVVMLMCMNHKNLSAMVTPRRDVLLLKHSSALHYVEYTYCYMVLLFVIERNWHLELNCTSQMFSHYSRHARPFCN